MIASDVELTPEAARARLREVRREIEQLHERDMQLGQAIGEAVALQRPIGRLHDGRRDVQARLEQLYAGSLTLEIALRAETCAAARSAHPGPTKERGRRDCSESDDVRRGGCPAR